MQYTCANCDHTFESDEEKPRCPKCLRRHGLIPDTGEDNDKKGAGRKAAGGSALSRELPPGVVPGRSARNKLIALVVVAVLVVGGVGAGIYFLVRKKPSAAVPDQVPLGPAKVALLKQVARKRGVPLETVYFAPDADVTKRGRALGHGGDARAVAGRILAFVRSGLPQGDTGKTMAGAKPWMTLRPTGRPKASNLMTAGQLFGALIQQRPVTVVDYELACLYLALARAAGLKAVLAEIYRNTDQKGPADPSGYLGHFGVALYTGPKYAGRPTLVVDPTRGRMNQAKEFEVLTDLEAAAHGLSLQGEALLRLHGAPADANEAIAGAVKLAPRSATVNAARGMLLLKTGGLEPGLDALRTARTLREDAPRYLLVGVAYALKKDFGRAMTNIDQAIGHDADYAQAYLWKAQFQLARGKLEEAVTQLDKAQELAPDLPEALVLRATLLTMKNKPTQAMALLRRALKKDPQNDDARFALFRLLYVTGDEQDANAEAKKWLAMVPQSQRGQLQQLIDGFKKAVKAQKARQPVPGAPDGAAGAGGDPYKLQNPGAGGAGAGAFPGGSSPFGKGAGSDPMLHL